MMFINECMYLSDQDSDPLLHRLISEPVLFNIFNMGFESGVDLLIKSPTLALFSDVLYNICICGKEGINRMLTLEIRDQT